MFNEMKEAFDKDGERNAMAAIKQYPSTLFWTTVFTGGHAKYVLYEFPFGSKYRSDFVVVWSCSGIWEVTFVECENTNDKVINQNGTPTKRFNQAVSQVRDWEEYIANNKLQIQTDLSEWCLSKDILGFYKSSNVCNEGGKYLSDAKTVVRFKYKIIMGRRSSIPIESRRKIEQNLRGYEFCSYDRLLDSAKEHDRHFKDRNASVNLGIQNGV